MYFMFSPTVILGNNEICKQQKKRKWILKLKYQRQKWHEDLKKSYFSIVRWCSWLSWSFKHHTEQGKLNNIVGLLHQWQVTLNIKSKDWCTPIFSMYQNGNGNKIGHANKKMWTKISTKITQITKIHKLMRKLNMQKKVL